MMVNKQEEEDDLIVDYNLSDTVYTKAKVNDSSFPLYISHVSL